MDVNELKIETGRWQNQLDGMQYETASMKTRLADAVKHTVSKSALNEAEEFQSLFLNKDTIISFIKSDIKKHIRHIDLDSTNEMDILNRQNKLRRDMERMETEFSNLKTAFTDFLIQLA